MTYLEAQDSVRERLSITKTVPQLLDAWHAFVDECEDGYEWDVSEYNNDIGCRDLIEVVLHAEDLLAFPEHGELQKQVEAIDGRFRSLLQTNCEVPNQQTWWRRGLLQRAGSDYVDYFKGAHGLHVELSE